MKLRVTTSLLLVVVLVCLRTALSDDHSLSATAPTDTDLPQLWQAAKRAAATNDELILVQSTTAPQELPVTPSNTPGTNGFTPNEGNSEVRSANYGAPPYHATGRVFYQRAGVDYTCSGAIVAPNLVLTAGHCVSAGDGTWHSNWVFVPQDTDEIWEANTFHTFKEWHNSKNYERDVAFVNMKLRNSLYIGGVYTPLALGSGLNLNDTNRPFFNVLGYPASKGGVLSQTYNYTSATLVQFNTNGVTSDLSEGASGGPWLTNVAIGSTSSVINPVNIVNGVTSYIAVVGTTRLPWVFSPVFDNEVMEIYSSIRQELPTAPAPSTPFTEQKVFYALIVLIAGVIVFSLLCVVLVIACKPKPEVDMF